MSDLFDRENGDIIGRMNKHLGTKQRDKPYDLNNTDDLKQILLLAVGAYCDYHHYGSRVDNLIEDFDESLEHYETITWFHMGIDPAKGSDLDEEDELASKCASVMNRTLTLLLDIEMRAVENLIKIVSVILNSPPDIQNAVLGKTYSIDPEEIDFRFEELIIALGEAQYHHGIQDNLNEFLKLMEELWTDQE